MLPVGFFSGGKQGLQHGSLKYTNGMSVTPCIDSTIYEYVGCAFQRVVQSELHIFL